MIGLLVESKRRFSWLAFFCLALGFALAGSGIWFDWSTLSIWSILPLAIGVSLLMLGRDRPFAARLTDEAIETVDHRFPDQVVRVIPYASLLGVRAGGKPIDPATFKPSKHPITLHHSGGVLTIPAHLNVSSADLYRFLAERLPIEGGRNVNPLLLPYLRRHEEQYGSDQVRTYQAATALSKSHPPRETRAVLAGVILAGVLWIAVGSLTTDNSEWTGGGVAALFFGSLFWLVTFATGSNVGRSTPGWKKASLVISPEGLAMIQGPVQGEVRWSELLSISYQNKTRGFRLHRDPYLYAVKLQVKGATIHVADLYDCPIYVIHQQILNAAPDHLQPVKPAPIEL